MPASRLRIGLLAGALGLTLAGSAAAQTEKPLYGGALEIGTVYVTLSALSWDPADWNWKLNHDTGQFYEQLVRRRSHQVAAPQGQASILCRRLAAVGCDPR